MMIGILFKKPKTTVVSAACWDTDQADLEEEEEEETEETMEVHLVDSALPTMQEVPEEEDQMAEDPDSEVETMVVLAVVVLLSSGDQDLVLDSEVPVD